MWHRLCLNYLYLLFTQELTGPEWSTEVSVGYLSISTGIPCLPDTSNHKKTHFCISLTSASYWKSIGTNSCLSMTRMKKIWDKVVSFSDKFARVVTFRSGNMNERWRKIILEKAISLRNYFVKIYRY